MSTPFQSAFADRQAALQAAAMKTSTPTAGNTSRVFQYSADIGVGDATPYIISMEKSSGIVLAVVSAYRAGDRGYHGSQNAVDFAGSVDAMRQVAEYLYQYSPFWLELIHTNANAPGGGYYVHDGQKVAQSFYDGPDISTGGNIIAGHRDHIHAASTVSAMRAAASATPDQIVALARASDVDAQIADRIQQSSTRKGCLKNVGTGALVLGGSGYGIAQLVTHILGG